MGERAAKGGRQMQVSEGSDTFEFRSPHGMKAAHSRLRTFAGIAVRHLQHFNHPGRAWHDLSGPQDTLTVVLAEIGGRCQARTNLHRPAALERQRPNHISFVPAEMRVWGYTDNMESVRELRLSFDRKSLGDWFGTDLDPGKAGNPKLMFHDQRAVECARLLAAECDASDPSMGLYGEGLTIALLSACFQGRPQKENSGLSVSQLRRQLAPAVFCAPCRRCSAGFFSPGLAPFSFAFRFLAAAFEALVAIALRCSAVSVLARADDPCPARWRFVGPLRLFLTPCGTVRE